MREEVNILSPEVNTGKESWPNKKTFMKMRYSHTKMGSQMNNGGEKKPVEKEEVERQCWKCARPLLGLSYSSPYGSMCVECFNERFRK